VQESYYPSCKGLGLKHIFHDPVGILAACRGYELIEDNSKRQTQLLGEQIYGVNFTPQQVRLLLGKIPRWGPPSHLKYLIERNTGRQFVVGLSKRRIGLRRMIDRIREIYRLTDEIIELLSWGYRRSITYVHAIINGNYGLSWNTLWVIHSEAIAVIRASDTESKIPHIRKRGLRYFRRRLWLDSMRAIFDAIALTFQEIRKRFPQLAASRAFNRGIRSFNRMKYDIIHHPAEISAGLKSLSNASRAFYYDWDTQGHRPGGLKPTGRFANLFACLGNNRKAWEIVSRLTRCLPPPLVISEADKILLHEGLEERLTSEPPPEVEGFREFMRHWFARNEPYELNITVQPSNSSAVGYRRSDGGHSKAYQDMIIAEWGHQLVNNQITEEEFSKPMRSDYNLRRRGTERMKLFGQLLATTHSSTAMPEKLESNMVHSHPIGQPATTPCEVCELEQGKGRDAFNRITALKANNESGYRHPFPFYRYHGGNFSTRTPKPRFKSKRKSRMTPSKRDLQYDVEVSYENLLKAVKQSHPEIKNFNDLEPEELTKVLEIWEQLSTLTDCETDFMSTSLNRLLKAACIRIVKSMPHLPIHPVVAPEKGVKTRMPTKGMSASNLIQQTLRQLMDCFMREDERTSWSLGGSKRIDLSNEPGPWYSQDLSTATDYHPFWMTRTIYEELIPYASRANLGIEELCTPEIFDKIFGPRILYPYSDDPHLVPSPPELKIRGEVVPFEAVTQVMFGQIYQPSHVPAYSDEEMLFAVSAYSVAYDNWISSLQHVPGAVITSTGAMMGEPTSWPGLAMVTAFSAHSVGVTKYDTCGDDALLPRMTPEKVEAYDVTTASLGGKLSKDKSYVHETKGIFCEAPFENGVERPFWPRSIWTAPPGGSKGEVNWASAVSSFRSHANRFGVRTRADLRDKGMFQYSALRREWAALVDLGVPLGATEMMGGLDHPSFPVIPKRYVHRWFDFLSGCKVRDLVVKGGLSLVPQEVKRDSILKVDPPEEYFSNTIPEGQLGSTVPPKAKDALQTISNPRNVLAFYYRGWAQVTKRPRIYNAFLRYKSRIYSRELHSGIIGTYDRLRKDIESKADRYYIGPIAESKRKREFAWSQRARIWSVPRRWRRPFRPGT